jgi:hypothetical protein
MIWLTWRQHRKQALFALVGLAVLAALLIPTGLQMYDAMADTGLRDCRRAFGQAQFVDLRAAEACDKAASAFNREYESRALLGTLLVFLPMLTGLFWGATLVAREVEHDTHRLVWTQGVTPLRWLLVKAGLVLGGTAVVATIYTLLTTWWLTPLVNSGANRIQFPFFDVTGLAPVIYSLFAVALGIVAGALSRKVLPAMAITLVGFIAVRTALAIIRPHFLPPLELRYPVTGQVVPNRFRGDWVLSEAVYDDKGNLLASNGTAICEPPPADAPQAPPDGAAIDNQANCSGYNALTYQPGDRFWLFQYLETSIFTVLTVLSILLTIHQIRRRIG